MRNMLNFFERKDLIRIDHHFFEHNKIMFKGRSHVVEPLQGGL